MPIVTPRDTYRGPTNLDPVAVHKIGEYFPATKLKLYMPLIETGWVSNGNIHI